jgi:hypothetical protein
LRLRRRQHFADVAYRLRYEPHNPTPQAWSGALKIIAADNGQVQDATPQWRHDKCLAGGGSLPDHRHAVCTSRAS